MIKTIGLFGTCGNSKWRDQFIEAFEASGISYFNPQVEDWNPALAEEEANHLANDSIILFPVTSETYGLGSLAESGFSVLQALLNLERQIIIYIDDKLDESLINDNPILAKESLRARKLVNAHLNKIKHHNITICSSLEEMFNTALRLWQKI